MWLETNIWISLRSLRGNLGFSQEMNKCGLKWLFEATQIMSSTRTTSQITSTLLGLFWEKIWSGPEKSKNVAKHPKLKVIVHDFGLSRGPSSKSHGMPPRNMGGNWKGVMWLETNIWMCLRLFRGNFGFHEKMKKWGVQKLFETMQMVSSTCATSQVTSTFLGMFREKIQFYRSPKMSQKQPKLKVIIHVFGLSRAPNFERHGIPPRTM